ncbi:hypothetical protein [Actinomadura sp. 7K507]|uniref:hypothetical protein n=1 Tax=Actinomadura sp. 7K507 TaxID=2530365 RepID=UPI001404461B|nr:hypothetical protein [Actinomadura sp. 7K507]
MHGAGMEIGWHSAGAIVSTLLDERYTVIIGSMDAAKPSTSESQNRSTLPSTS